MTFNADDVYLLNQRGGELNNKVKLAHGIGRVMATFDATGGKATGSYGLKAKIPANAIVLRAFYKVVTTFTSAGSDAGTIALQVEGADDLVAAVAISDVSNPWDAAAPVATIADDAIGNVVETTAERELTAVVATQDLTAGKLYLFVEYWTHPG